MKSYCVKQKNQTECVEPSGYKRAKNGKLMYFCKCAECGIMKFKFVKNNSATRGAAPLLSAEAVGGSFDEAILETMGKLGKVGLSKAIKSNMSKKAASKMVDKMLDKIASNIN